LSSPAEAQIFTQEVEPGTCTTDPDFELDPPSTGDGVISNIVEYIKGYVGNVSQALFEAIRIGILGDLTWALSLYIAIFGILFTFGLIQVTAHDFTMRMIKIGIIMALFQPTAYQFFTSTVIVFFQASTDDIINFTTSKAFGTAFNSGDKVFYVFDDVATKAASGKM